MSGLPELQQAVRQIPGIANAVVRWPDPHGPACLRVEFVADCDEEAVGEEVIRTLADVGGVDLSTLQLERVAVPAWSNRPVFSRLILERQGPELTVEVGLAFGGHDVTGRAHRDRSEGVDLLVVGEATLAALRNIDDSREYAIRHIGHATAGGVLVVQVLVDLVSGGDHSGPLLGGAKVGHDDREATVRATLNAVNRHFEVTLHPAESALVGQ